MRKLADAWQQASADSERARIADGPKQWLAWETWRYALEQGKGLVLPDGRTFLLGKDPKRGDIVAVPVQVYYPTPKLALVD
jgi:hypothetical protein